MQASLPLNERRPWQTLAFPNGEWVLLVGLALEIAAFSALAPSFFSFGNFFEVVRLSVELGLLALALTPIMITGGIDLSVGSIMGLSTVVFGVLWRDGGLPIGVAALLAVLLGCAGGALNALLITRLDIPPIIVTLGSFSMFRGIAEGITHGAVNYSGFPKSFLMLGQGYIAGVIPVQFPLFLLALGGYFVLLHRSAVGRTIYAIGYSGAGARYAGPMPGPATSWPRSPRSCSAARRYSAAAARYGARCSGCFRFPCCKTDCASRPCLPK